MIRLKLISHFVLAGQNTKASSANSRWEIPTPCLSGLIPSNKPHLIAQCINKLNISTARTKRKSDKGSPYLRPCSMLKGAFGEPFTRIEIQAGDKQHFMQRLQVSPKPIISRTRSKKSQLMVSQAFQNSSFRRAALTLFLLPQLIISLVKRAPSRICLPPTKAD